jgi:hypothetical protein
MKILFELGMGQKEAQLLFGDLERGETLFRTGTGYQWFESLAVSPLIMSIGRLGTKRSRKPYHKLSSQEVFLRCVRLSRELEGRAESH